MNPKCIAQVTAAAGRALTGAQIKAIDDRISETMRRLARQDPQGWQAKSMDQRVTEAATLAMQEVQAAAARKVENAQRQVLKTLETTNRIATQQQLHNGWSRSRALVEDLTHTQHYIEGLKKEAVGSLMDLIDAAGSKQGAGAGRRVLQMLFDAENPQMTRDLTAEIFAGTTGRSGNPEAKAGARAWLDTIEAMRQRFNAAGGDVGRLDYGYLPQPHDQARIRDVGADAWAAKTLDKLDRTRYLREDGTLMNDAEVLGLLRASWETLATDGLNKTEPGAFRGNGARANRGSDSRVLHFKDGDAFLAYNAEFGRGSMYDAMIGHIGAMARDIGLVERMGPNPENQFRLQLDLAERADGVIRTSFANKPQAYWSILTGKTGADANGKIWTPMTPFTGQYANLANFGQHARNIQTFAKLGGAVLSSITDLGTIMVTTGYNKLSYWDLLKNTATAAGADAKEFANMHGLIAESMTQDLNRWQGENIANNWSGRLANATMRLSLMNAWTDTLRRGFSLTMQAGLGKLAGKDWASLTEWDRSHLQRKGITPDDWAVISAAKLTEYRGQQMLTPESIAATGDPRAAEVTAKVLGLITDESEYAVINPDIATRAIQTWGGQQAGTGVGELARATMQFKSFPTAMMSRHWRRILDAPAGIEGAPGVVGGQFGALGVGPVTVNRAAYIAALMLTTTALGAISFQLKQIKDGKDPVDMTTPKFWIRAAAQGGGAGFVGDLILGDTTQDRGQLDTLGRLALGPSFGSLADVWELGKGNIDEWLAGKETHFWAEALKFAKGHAPLVNIWYGKAALDHLLLHSVQENLSPGYLDRMRKRAQKDWEQDYWWEPGEAVPERMPDFGAVAGQ